MKGVIFKHLETFVRGAFGDEFCEDLLDATELRTEGPFLGPGTYPDEDLFALVGTLLARTGLSLEDALFTFGKALFPMLVEDYPGAIERDAGLRTFLASIDSVIHVEVRKLYPEAITPSVDFLAPRDGDPVMRYRSERGLCALFRGLLCGASEHFREPLEVRETTCAQRGGECCEFELRFPGSGSVAA